MQQSVTVRPTSRAEKALRQSNKLHHQFSHGILTSVTQFLITVINLYSFPIELKPRIAKIQIYETVKVTKMIYSLNLGKQCRSWSDVANTASDGLNSLLTGIFIQNAIKKITRAGVYETLYPQHMVAAMSQHVQ